MSRHRVGLWGKAVGTSGEIVAGMIRPYSRTRGSRSVLRCRHHTRCRGSRAHAIPWQKPLLQQSECDGTGRHLSAAGSPPIHRRFATSRIRAFLGYPSVTYVSLVVLDNEDAFRMMNHRQIVDNMSP